jgi:membrane fusion protein (multidrug efflux system)
MNLHSGSIMKSRVVLKKLAIMAVTLSMASGVMAQSKSITNVETLELASRQLTVHSSYVGHLQPLERVVIRAEAEGIIEKIHFDEGQPVKKGSTLVDISTERLALNVKLAKANYDLAESDYKTEKLLFDRNVATAANVDSRRTNRDVRKINLELAELDLEKSHVKASISGVVKTKHLDEGELANRGGNLFEIMDISKVLAAINIPEREIRFVSPQKDVKVRIDAIPGTVFNGTVHTLGLEADLQNRSFPAEILLDNPTRQLLPGMMARVEMVTMAEPSEIIIPSYAILEREANRIVFIEKNGMAIERPVILGTVVKDEVQVLSGLQSGDKLIVTGQHFLTNEERVTVLKAFKQKAETPSSK